MLIKRGKSGGLINLQSFIYPQDYKEIEYNLRTASSRTLLREAEKEGLQSLYADPKEAIEKYKEKDFDIVEAISERKNEKLLWVRARAIDADTVNSNGDYFSKEELLKEVEIKGKKMPAYKTFIGVPVYTNHKNDDIAEAKGEVVHAEWDDKENCVYVTFYIDELAYPGIARGIRMGYMHDVSMGCQVSSGTCSICKNIAQKEEDYCIHMKEYKGKIWPETGEKAFEYNHDIKFIELSIVSDGAFENCEIEEIYDAEEILNEALKLNKKAKQIHNNIVIASSVLPTNITKKRAYEDCLRQMAKTTNYIVKLAQMSTNLVGGQLLASEGAGQNTTVSKILQFLGIDPQAGLNILDMLNLALNFLEVGVINLFARKDNIDLSHVGKITKAMADLQAAMQDMVEDGIDMGGPSALGNVPLNQNALQQTPQSQQPTNIPQQEYQPSESGVGQVMTPVKQMSDTGIGGGVLASNSTPFIVWAQKNNNKKRQIFASSNVYTKISNNNINNNKVVNVLIKLAELAKHIGFNFDNNINNYKTNNYKHGGNIMNNNDFLKAFAQQYRMQNAPQISMDFSIDDANGNRITISSADGSIKAYVKGQRVVWDKVLSEEQLNDWENGRIDKVAYQLLKEFGRYVEAEKQSGRKIKAWVEPITNGCETQEEKLEDYHKGVCDEPKELLLESNEAARYRRKGTEDVTREDSLEDLRIGTEDALKEDLLETGLYNRKDIVDELKEQLLEDVRYGTPVQVLEEKLEEFRCECDKVDNPEIVVNAVVSSLADSVIKTKTSATEIIKQAKKLANRADIDKLIHLASIKNKNSSNNIDYVILSELGKSVNRRINAKQLAKIFKTVVSQKESYNAVFKTAQNKLNNNPTIKVSSQMSEDDKIKAILSLSNSNGNYNKKHIYAALSAFANTSIETGCPISKLTNIINDISEEELFNAIEYAQKPSIIEQRLAMREQKMLWGNVRVAATNADIYEVLVGWMADYASSYGFSNKTPYVKAAKRLAKDPIVTAKLTNKIIKAHLNKQSAIEITDEKSKNIRIICTVDDIGNIDVQSPDFEELFRNKIMDILENSGHQIDRNTFTLTNLDINADGQITACINSRVIKTFKPNMGSSINMNEQNEIDNNDLSSKNINMSNIPMNINEYPSNEYPSNEYPSNINNINLIPSKSNEDVTELITPSALQLKQAKKRRLLNRYAQMPPATPPMPAGGGALGMPTGGFGGATGTQGTQQPTDLGAGMGPGAGTMTNEPSMPNMEEEGLNSEDNNLMGDIENEKLEKKPWGTICPQCGSSDVDVTNGEGHCNSCDANIEYEYVARVKPSNENDIGGIEQGTEPGEMPLGEEGEEEQMGNENTMGGQAAGGMGGQAAGGMGGQAAGGMGGGATPPVMAKMRYLTDPMIFVRFAVNKGNVKLSKKLPVGFICPACGSKKVIKSNRNTYCLNCKTKAITNIKTCKSNPSKLISEITWIA